VEDPVHRRTPAGGTKQPARNLHQREDERQHRLQQFQRQLPLRARPVDRRTAGDDPARVLANLGFLKESRIFLRGAGYSLKPHRDPKWGFLTCILYLARPDDKEEWGTQIYSVDEDIEARGAGKGQASDADILSLLQKMIKQRQESMAIYEQNARPELAQQEREEAAVIASFLPRALDEGETRAAIEAAISETGAASMKDMGKVIGVLRSRFAGRMDFAKASGLVKEMLPKG